MNEVLKTILSLSFSGALLILTLYMFYPLFKERLSKQWQYYIWLIVVARLIVPFAPDINLTSTLFQEIDRSTEQIKLDLPTNKGTVYKSENEIFKSDNVESNNNVQNNLLETIGLDTWPNIIIIGWNNLWLVWLVVALILMAQKITVYQSFIKYIRAGCMEVTDIDLLERFGNMVEQNKVKTTVELYINNLISSPLIIGFFRPCIVLPSTNLPETDFQYTILHELTHYKRGDMFYKWFVQFTICIHWFNPFVYLMGREINRACELSCDETIIKSLNTEERRAYGDTLLNAMSLNGTYNDSLASVTLNESKELLKERLEAIMIFKKGTRLTAITSIALVFIICFGATMTGAYTKALPANIKETVTNQPKQQNPLASPQSNLTLVKKEYTIDELTALDISGVIVEAFSENVTIARGGNTLKLEYYTNNQNEYTLQREDDGGKTRWNLCLMRVNPPNIGETARSVTITIPYDVNLKTIKVVTDSGDINLEECTASMFMLVETQSGNVLINNGYAEEFFAVETKSGTALISGTTLPARGVEYASAKFYTENGTIMFQPANSVWDYRYRLDTGENAKIFVNGKQYQGGGGNINNFSRSQISVEIPNDGSFIVQDLNLGKLSITDTAKQLNQFTSKQFKSVDNSDLTLVKKEYTEDDLQQMGVTGLRIEAKTENIVVNQGGNSLILTYYQSNNTDYTLSTWDYEIFHGEFSTPEDIAMNGGKSGIVKELKLTSKVSPISDSTIYITLPADPKYSRIVQLFSSSGSVKMNNCKSTSMIATDTESGNINLQNCSSPMLGVKTRSGNIDISNCSVKELNSTIIRNGAMSLQLADSAENYQMSFDTAATAQITINNKNYQGGEFILNKNAPNSISFNCYKSGSLVIMEGTNK